VKWRGKSPPLLRVTVKARQTPFAARLNRQQGILPRYAAGKLLEVKRKFNPR